ncbi:MAG: hypothetical protein ABIH83_00430 [Candidatus Micrarchaeota archaeon]
MAHILVFAKNSIEALIKNSKKLGVQNFFKENSSYSLAMALVTDSTYKEYSSPDTHYKMFILVAEALDNGWVSREFICDLNGKNICKISKPGKEPMELKELGLSSQAEIMFYEPGNGVKVYNRTTQLARITNEARSSDRNFLNITNWLTKKTSHHHIAVIQ